MTRDEFIVKLINLGYSYKIEGDKIIVNDRRAISWTSLTTIPSGVVFMNGGYVDFPSVNTMYPGVEFRNNGDVSLRSLRAIPYDVVLRNNGDIDLRDLTMIPSRLRFNNAGNVLLKWKFDIEGIRSKEILNTMIKRKIII